LIDQHGNGYSDKQNLKRLSERDWAKAPIYYVLSANPGLKAGAIIKSFNCQINKKAAPGGLAIHPLRP
jgi:hypothetical protein